MTSDTQTTTGSTGTPGLSYKFQRLRERIRAAVESGELSGKLPGERALAKRFNVNAKTLSKALTDLAAEGLLDRSIGRGTFVKGSAPAAAALVTGRWLAFCTPGQADGSLIAGLKLASPDMVVHTDRQWDLRPSFLQPFVSAISFDPDVPEALLRDLVVRNVNVVTVDYEPKVFSMHAVLDDSFTNAARLARELLMEGHRQFVVVEARPRDTVARAVRETAGRIAPEATVDVVDPSEVSALTLAGGMTFVAESTDVAAAVRFRIGDRHDVTIWAIGCTGGQPEAGGVYTDERHKVDAIVNLLNDPPARPSTVWLAGQYVGPRVTPDNGSSRVQHAHLVRNALSA